MGKKSQIIINNNVPQSPPPPAHKQVVINFPKIKLPSLKLERSPHCLEDWLFAGVSFLILLFVFEPNIYGKITKPSTIGQFFTDNSLPVKAASKITKKEEPASVSVVNNKKYFPMAGWSSSRAKSKIVGWVGDCRPPDDPTCPNEHHGIDYAILGPVVSSLDGKVVETQLHKIGGIIGIESQWKGHKYLLRYIHVDKQPLKKYITKPGEGAKYVKAGEPLSKISTKFPGSTGPHLHMEVYKLINGRWVLQTKPQDFWDDSEQ